MIKHKTHIKIIHFGNFPFGNASANFLRNLALALALNENNVVEVVLPYGYYYGKYKNKTRKGTIGDVSYKYIGLKNHPKIFLLKGFDYIISEIVSIIFLLKEKFKNKINIIILYNSYITNIFPILLIKIFFKVKLIIILPEFYSKPTSFLAKIRWINFYIGLKYLVNYFDGAIVLSHFLDKFVKKRTNSRVKTYILPNIIDPDIFNIKNNRDFIKGKITIGYCGTPTRKDGIIYLIKSFALLNKKNSNTHLLIIGDITNGSTIIPELKKLAGRLNILDKITFTGLVPFSEIPKLLNACQILALTRPKGIFAEAGFPTKLGEYFACKKPVVVTNVGDIPIYFTNGKHVILTEAENITSIVNGFEKLLVSSELREYIAKNAYKWMDDNLNYRKVSNNINYYINKL